MAATRAPEPAGRSAGAGAATTTRQVPGWLLLQGAQERLADCEARYFSGAAHQDELRQAYVDLQQAERAVLEGRT